MAIYPEQEIARDIMIAWLPASGFTVTGAAGGKEFHPENLGQQLGEIYKALVKAVRDSAQNPRARGITPLSIGR